ncbi:MAG: dephospho-CoA kinase [Gemmatimonadetes bacterium]|nr:dephospho-CoA kinase [Gemmatimonadota bacterium]
MLNVALTGNLASGKSTVARIWREAGVPVVSADELSRQAVLPGSTGLEQVRDAFGDQMIRADGTLDRDGMRRLIFGDEGARRRLEGILHPRIANLREEWLEARRREGRSLVVSEIPLLFEAGLEGTVDLIVVVHAAEEERMRRIVADRRLSPDEVRGIMAAQGDATRTLAAADFVLENDGAPEELEAKALDLLASLKERARGLAPEQVGSTRGAGRARLDLHLHTRGSWDSLSDPEKVLARAKERGLDRIAITDHNRMEVALEWAEREPDRVIPGEEVRTREGIDVIGLYLSRPIPKGTPARGTCLEIKRQGGIVYLPHPFARGKGGSGRLAEELVPLLDVVEVFNARLLSRERNRLGLEFARKHGLLQSAGSDAHTVGEVGNAWVELPRHPNRPEALLEALREGSVGGRAASPLAFVGSNLAKIYKRARGSAYRP